MNKPLFTVIYFLSLLIAGLTIHQAFAERGPAVEPMTEVSIEENRPVIKNGEIERGYDFTNSKRVPANILSKEKNHSNSYSIFGPLLFLLALPLALWIIVTKKMKNKSTSENIGYYPKTFQFVPNKKNKIDAENEYSDSDDDDISKAS